MISRRSFFKAIAGPVAGIAAVEALPKSRWMSENPSNYDVYYYDPETVETIQIGWSQMTDKLAVPIYRYTGEWFKAC